MFGLLLIDSPSYSENIQAEKGEIDLQRNYIFGWLHIDSPSFSENIQPEKEESDHVWLVTYWLAPLSREYSARYSHLKYSARYSHLKYSPRYSHLKYSPRYSHLKCTARYSHLYPVFTGTTLTQELVYLVQTLDFERANNVNLDERFPIIEVIRNDMPFYGGLKMVEELPSPRFIKSHLHHFLLPEQLRSGKGKVNEPRHNILYTFAFVPSKNSDQSAHYANKLIQIYWKFHHQKLKVFG